MSSTTLTGAVSVPEETAQAEAVSAPARQSRLKSAYENLKATRFSFRRHLPVAALFALIVASPLLLTAAFRDEALRVWITFGGWQVTCSLFVLETIAVAYAVRVFLRAVVKDGAK